MASGNAADHRSSGIQGQTLQASNDFRINKVSHDIDELVVKTVFRKQPLEELRSIQPVPRSALPPTAK
jgi:hypothetical protein